MEPKGFSEYSLNEKTAENRIPNQNIIPAAPVIRLGQQQHIDIWNAEKFMLQRYRCLFQFDKPNLHFPKKKFLFYKILDFYKLMFQF